MASARKIKLTDSKKRKIDPKKIEEALGAEFIGKVNDPQDGLNLYNERRKYIFLQDIIKQAAEVRHADQACNLVYFINNYVNALEPAWRDWHCEKHGWGGDGAVKKCPRCAK